MVYELLMIHCVVSFCFLSVALLIVPMVLPDLPKWKYKHKLIMGVLLVLPVVNILLCWYIVHNVLKDTEGNT